MRDFDAVFDQLPAHTKATRNLIGGAAIEDKFAQRRIRNERCRANSVSGFFIGFVVVTRKNSIACFFFVGDNNGKTIRTMAEKYVRDFFHERRAIPLRAMCGIQNDQTPTIRQRPRTCASGPFIRPGAEQVFARFIRQAFDLIEINDQQFRKFGQRKRIERLLALDAGKITQPQRVQFKLFSLFAGRKKIQHDRL